MSLYIEVAIDHDQIVGACNSGDKTYLVKRLLQRMPTNDIIDVLGNMVEDYQKQLLRHYLGNEPSDLTVNQKIFQEDVLKISRNYISLTKEEEEIIANIAKRF
jgi:hypothetical protein